MDSIFSQEQINIIKDMYLSGAKVDSIITAFNTDEKRIRKILKDNELDRHYNIWSDELYDRAILLYQSGKTFEQIANILLVSENGLSHAFKKRHIEKRTYAENNRKYSRNSEYFDNIDTPNKAYILGLIYADGNNYNHGDKHCLTISLQENDYDLLNRVKQELEYEGPLRLIPLHDKKDSYKNQYMLAITDEHLCAQLKKIGVKEKKSLSLTFPSFLRPDLIRHFVRGYFDGDGCLSYDYKRNKMHTCLAGTSEFLDRVSKLLDAMFIKHNIVHPKQCKDNNTYTLWTAANLSSYKFLSWMYRDCDMKLDRKYQRYLEFCEKYKNPKGRIKSL